MAERKVYEVRNTGYLLAVYEREKTKQERQWQHSKAQRR